MSKVFVKLRIQEKSKYRKLISVDENLYQSFNESETSSFHYTAGASLSEGEWFFIEDFSTKKYAKDSLLLISQSSVDYESLKKEDFEKIDYLFTTIEENIYFQNIFKSRLVQKKGFFYFGEKFEYINNCQELVINEFPDAIYIKKTDRLYFRKLESITCIFKGIDQLYREATEEEVDNFLKKDFVTLKDGFTSKQIKTANRKRIAISMVTLDRLSLNDKENIFSYIGEYCPDLKTEEKSFEVGNENELKMLLLGIEQRFYTTPIGGEKRIANSVISFSKGGKN